MQKIGSVAALETLGRVRLSENFFMRDFLYSEIANFYGEPNIPEDPELAVEAARGLCINLLEPLSDAFGRVSIRSGYRSPTLNAFGNSKKLNCGSNEYNRAGHIYDWRDADGHLGATACIVVNAFADLYEETGRWQALAWFIHDHLPYNSMYFFPKLAAFNLNWNEARQERWIKSYVSPKGTLTKAGMENHGGDHASDYDFPLFREAAARLAR